MLIILTLYYQNQVLLNSNNLLKKFPIAEQMIAFIVEVIRNTRPKSSDLDIVKKYVSYGAGPRASQNIVISSKAKAALSGKYAVNKKHILEVLYPILNHRIILNYSAYSDDISVKSIIEEIVNYVEKK